MPILNIEPSSGTGNTSVQIGSSDYKGRANRSAAVRFQATSGDQPYIDVAVTQLGLGDLVNLDSSSASLEDEGGTVTITGTSNLASMLVSGFEGLNLTGASYTIDSGSEQTLAPSDEMIITPAGDPGKDAPYKFSIKLVIGANSSSSSVESEVMISNGSSVSKTFTITQGMAAIFNVDPTSLSFGGSASGEEIEIISNEGWICTSELPDWISLSEDSGEGSATITVSVTESTEDEDRTFDLGFESDSGLTASVKVTQAAAGRSYSDVTVSLTYPEGDIPASGGMKEPTVTYSQTWGYNGSTTGGGTITTGGSLTWKNGPSSVSSGTVTGDDLGKTSKERTLIGDMEVTVTLNGKSGTATADVYQQANEESMEWGDISLDIPEESHTFTKDEGSWDSEVTATQSGTKSWTSGATEFINGDVSVTLSESADWLTVSGTVINCTANSGSERSASVSVSVSGEGSKTASGTINITQEIGAYLNVTPASLNFEASGGTQTITIDTNESWTIE